MNNIRQQKKKKDKPRRWDRRNGEKWKEERREGVRAGETSKKYTKGGCCCACVRKETDMKWI